MKKIKYELLEEEQEGKEESSIAPQDEPITFLSKRQAFKDIVFLGTPFMAVNLIQIASSYFTVYLVASIDQQSLGGLSLVITSSGILINAMNAIIYPVNIMASAEFGKINKLRTNSQENLHLVPGPIEGSRLEDIKESQKNIGLIVQQGWIVGTFGGAIGSFVLWNLEPILRLFDQPKRIIPIAGSIGKVYAIAFPLMLWLRTNIDLTSSVGEQKILPFYTLFLSLITFGSSYLFINGGLGIPAYGVVGYSYASIFQQVAGILFFTLFFLKNKNIKAYHLFSPRLKSLNFLPFLKTFGTLGYPIFIVQVVTGTVNFLINMWYGKLGIDQIIIEQAAGQPLAYFYGITGAITSASSRLVSRCYGPKSKDVIKVVPEKAANDIQTYGKTALKMVTALSVIPIFLYTVVPDKFAGIYMTNEQVQQHNSLIRACFFLNAATISLSQLQDLSSNLLNNIHNTKYPAFVSAMVSALFILPSTYLASNVFDWNIIGIDSVILAGVMMSSSIIVKRWIKESSQLLAPINEPSKPDNPWFYGKPSSF